MARLGDEVYDWNVDQLTDWLRSEGLDDCVGVFIHRRIDGLKLLNLTDSDLRNLQVSRESGKKLSKVIEKFKKRKRGKFDRMFGNTQATVVTTRKPSSFSHDEDDSDEGWGTDEWDSDPRDEENVSSGDDGEYLEPEDDFSQSTGSPLRTEPSAFQTGVVAQLREGIAQSLRRGALQHQAEEEEDIYDVPPEEEDPEDEDLYEEPSDNSGGAVVVRPPAKPPRVESGLAYVTMRGEESQDTYEAPMEGEDISQSPSNQQRFIPTEVQPHLQDITSNDETYELPEFTSDDDQYEVAPQSPEAPPPRPPKMSGKPSSLPSQCPARPPKQQSSSSNPISSASPQKTVYCKPPQSRQVPQEPPNFQGNSLLQQRAHLPKTNNYPPRQPSPSQGAGPRSPRNFHNKPAVEPKQSPLAHSHNIQPDSGQQPKPILSTQSTTFQGIPKQPEMPLQPKLKPKPSPLQSWPLTTHEKRPPLAPKTTPKSADPAKRDPAPPPGLEPTRIISGSKTGLPDSPKRQEPVPRKASDPLSPGRPEKIPDTQKPQVPRKVSDPPSPKRFDQKTTVSTVDAGRVPQTLQRGRGDPPPLPPDSPKKATSGPQAKRSGPLPATPGQERLSQQSHSEPPLPPRPPKTGASQTAPANQRKGVPLPHLQTNSSPSSRDAKEQSSGSSLESGSADEPVVPLPSRNKQRGLPPTPVEKSPLDVMKEAPWFHGSVNRKISETNLRASNREGAFLVRNSTNNPNEYSLSLFHAGKIRHLKIPKKEDQYVLGTSGIKKFDNIIDLVSYYRQNDVDLANGGKTKLTVHAPNISQ